MAFNTDIGKTSNMEFMLCVQSIHTVQNLNLYTLRLQKTIAIIKWTLTHGT